MAPQSTARALKKPLRLDDEVRFLRSWIEKPLHMGAVMPSSKVLARAVARNVDINSTAPVIELGPGTGAITDALVKHGVAEKRLVLVEYDPGFCALMRERCGGFYLNCTKKTILDSYQNYIFHQLGALHE